MGQFTRPVLALAALAVAATLTAGCAGTRQGLPGTASRRPVSTAIVTPMQGGSSLAAAPQGRNGGQGGPPAGSPAAAAGLPADWPPDLPVPPGVVGGSTGSAGHWTVLIVAEGSAAQVRQSAVDTYAAAGFSVVSDSLLNKGDRQITLVVENRDHSATQTNLMIGVTTR